MSTQIEANKTSLSLVGKYAPPLHSAEKSPRKTWHESLILPDVSIRDALKIMDSASQRILLITDSNLYLLGVASDGDIRRGFINGVSLTDPISTVMNTRPKTAPKNTPNNELLAIMSRLDLLGIPILENGRVVGLETLTRGLACSYLENPVFLMAGGGGTRLRPLTEDCPKPLLHVGDKPILEQIICRFSKSGFRNFFISTHYMPEKIQEYFGNGDNWNVNIQYIHEESPLGTAGALGLLPPSAKNLPIILMNGDVLTNVDFTKLLSSHIKNNADATICAREYEHQIPYGVIENSNDEMIGMVEKPKIRFKINAGIYVINADIVKKVTRNQHIDMPTLLEQQIKLGKKVRTYTIEDYWLDIGSIADFNKAQIDIQTLNA